MPEVTNNEDTIIYMAGTPVRFQKNKEWIYTTLSAEQSKALNPWEHVEPDTALYATFFIVCMLLFIRNIGKQRGIPVTESSLNKELKDQGRLN